MSFAKLSPERRREISQMGGRAVHAAGTGHEWTSETAQAAGRKGGRASQKSRRAKKTEITVVETPESQARRSEFMAAQPALYVEET
jgi:general stress protein YciG